jgi:tRNA pseudouridine55 synthase
MESQDVKNAISGVLVVDKPVGMTSHDVVQVIRNGTGLRRAGHTGTLDPRASGVLVVLVGPAVRLSEFVSASDKRYQAIIRLGSATDTFDADGKVTQPEQQVNVTEDQFEKVLATFAGRSSGLHKCSAVKCRRKACRKLPAKRTSGMAPRNHYCHPADHRIGYAGLRRRCCSPSGFPCMHAPTEAARGLQRRQLVSIPHPRR